MALPSWDPDAGAACQCWCLWNSGDGPTNLELISEETWAVAGAGVSRVDAVRFVQKGGNQNPLSSTGWAVFPEVTLTGTKIKTIPRIPSASQSPFSVTYGQSVTGTSYSRRDMAWWPLSYSKDLNDFPSGRPCSPSLLHPIASHHAAAAAKSLQSCPTLCDPTDGNPPGYAVPGILQARTLEWVAICFSNAWKWKVKVKTLSRVRLLATPWTASYQASSS